MGSKGDAYDNAAMESFFATLQTELLDHREWETVAELESAIFHFIEVFYNRKRRHSSLGYVSPAEYETRYAQRKAAAWSRPPQLVHGTGATAPRFQAAG